MIQRIEALPDGVREMDIFQSMLAMERRRMADPVWQAKMRRQEAELLRSYVVYGSVALCAVTAFVGVVLYDPLGLFTWMAQLALDNVVIAVPVALIMPPICLTWLKSPELVSSKQLMWALDAVALGSTLCIGLLSLITILKVAQLTFQQF